MAKGTIKKLIGEKGFGFIKTEEAKEILDLQQVCGARNSDGYASDHDNETCISHFKLSRPKRDEGQLTTS